MIMLGTARGDDDAFGCLQSTPAALGGTTQSPYLVVSDADEVYRRAKAAGAEIVIEIKDEDYGGRGFSCRDPEGHLVERRQLRSVADALPTRMTADLSVALAFF